MPVVHTTITLKIVMADFMNYKLAIATKCINENAF
jgi:hypothetical protein